jgi:hypothetical protein
VSKLAAIASACVLCACSQATVVRVIDGREVAGRFVSARAYALYARGAESEARGDLEDARAEYLAAGEEDGENAEIWTRIGAVSCALGRADDARQAFDRAAEHGDDYEPLHRERALCALAQAPLGKEAAAAALAEAGRALALDPDSEQTALLYARAAEAAGDPALAERVLRELVVRAPGRVAGWRALRDFAERRGDAPASARAARALTLLAAEEPPGTALAGAADARVALLAKPPQDGAPGTAASAPGVPSASPSASPAGPASSGPAAALLDDVDAAIARDSLGDARSAAKRARLPPAELAVRAAALGKATLAKAQAQLVHLADPSSSSAAIALAVAADLSRDAAGVTDAFSDAAALTTPPSPLARLLLAELLLRRTGRDAARAYLGPLTAPPETPDSLLRTVAARVIASLRE